VQHQRVARNVSVDFTEMGAYDAPPGLLMCTARSKKLIDTSICIEHGRRTSRFKLFGQRYKEIA